MQSTRFPEFSTGGGGDGGGGGVGGDGGGVGGGGGSEDLGLLLSLGGLPGMQALAGVDSFAHEFGDDMLEWAREEDDDVGGESDDIDVDDEDDYSDLDGAVIQSHLAAGDIDALLEEVTEAGCFTSRSDGLCAAILVHPNLLKVGLEQRFSKREISRESKELLKRDPNKAIVWLLASKKRVERRLDGPALVVVVPKRKLVLASSAVSSAAALLPLDNKGGRKSLHFGGNEKPLDTATVVVKHGADPFSNTKAREYSLLTEQAFALIPRKREPKDATKRAREPEVPSDIVSFARSPVELAYIQLMQDGVDSIRSKKRKIEILTALLDELRRSADDELDSHAPAAARNDHGARRPLLLTSLTTEVLLKRSVELIVGAEKAEKAGAAWLEEGGADLRQYVEEVRKRSTESLLRAIGINLPSVSGFVEDFRVQFFIDFYDDILSLTAALKCVSADEFLSLQMDILNVLELNAKESPAPADFKLKEMLRSRIGEHMNQMGALSSNKQISSVLRRFQRSLAELTGHRVTAYPRHGNDAGPEGDAGDGPLLKLFGGRFECGPGSGLKLLEVGPDVPIGSLGITLTQDPWSGVVFVDSEPACGSQAARLGIHNGDVLVGVNDRRFSLCDDLEAIHEVFTKQRPLILRLKPAPKDGATATIFRPLYYLPSEKEKDAQLESDSALCASLSGVYF